MLLAWPKHACGAFLRACAWAVEHATQDRCSARYDAFWWARGCSLVQEMRARSEVPYVVSTFW